jgi:putative transposase
MNPDHFYHIYNRANGKEQLFITEDNYGYFLRQFKKYISPIAAVYAYCLIPNHFHFVLRIKKEEQLKLFFKSKLKNKNKNQTGLEDLSGLISKQFSNFFNSYAKAFNKRNSRTGNLFQRPFKKKIITDNIYLQQVILYVHLNPVKHKVDLNFFTYPYSSYFSILSSKPTLIKREAVISLFDDKDNFKFVHHEQKIKTALINEIIKEDQ